MSFLKAYYKDIDAINRSLECASDETNHVIRDLISKCPHLSGTSVEELFRDVLRRGSVCSFAYDTDIDFTCHRVWLTNPDDPFDPTDEYGEELLYSIRQGFGVQWRHIFWTNDRLVLPRLKQHLALANINFEIRYIGDYMSPDCWRSRIESLINDKKYVSASDILRVYVLYKYGGVYCDMGQNFKEQIDDLPRLFRYGFIYTSQYRMFQNCFMMLPKNNLIGKLFESLVEDPYLYPYYLLSNYEPWMELHIYGATMITAIFLTHLRGQPSAILEGNGTILKCSNRQSWYAVTDRKHGRFGNVVIPSAPATFLEKDKWLSRRNDILDLASST